MHRERARNGLQADTPMHAANMEEEKKLCSDVDHDAFMGGLC